MQLSIDAASLDTGNQRRDTHLRSADFFDTERQGSALRTGQFGPAYRPIRPCVPANADSSYPGCVLCPGCGGDKHGFISQEDGRDKVQTDMWPSHPNGTATSPSADLELIAESIPQIVFIAGPDGATEHFNQRGTDYTGLPQDANHGVAWTTMLAPEDVERVAEAWAKAVAGKTPLSTEYRLRRFDGELRWQSVSALPVRSGDGEIVKWIGTVSDIEDQRRLEQSLRASERQTAEALSLLETLQNTAPIGFGFVDRDFRLVHMNDALAATTGVPKEQQLGRTVAEVIPELWPELGPVYQRVLDTGVAVINSETTGELSGDPGHVRTWLTSIYPVRLEEEVIGIGIVAVDITERKAMELELRRLSEHDPVTGLYNRGQLFVELERALRYATRYGHAGAVLVLDVDNFKWTNDSYGHGAGDQVLACVAAMLKSRLRTTDIVGRVGGDEFAVVLPETTEEQARTVALELRALLYERPTGPPVHVSIGIALFSGSARQTADDLLVAADLAMYQVKEAGGDQAAVYDGRSEELMSRVKDLRDALTEHRFVLYAQPIVDLPTGRIARHELLIRMVSDQGEIIAPHEFLPVAERFSLAVEIDRWVIGEALALARHEPVTANLSGRSVGDPEILAAVRKAIADGLDPGNVIFEITETALMTDFDRALTFVSALTELGCDLALDDFGTGFGSFTYLKSFPARYLKIDMEFVRDVNNDPPEREINKEIVRSIVRIARTLGKETIAEGVESAAVLETLCELGVDYAQGFHIGRPAPLAPTPAAA